MPRSAIARSLYGMTGGAKETREKRQMLMYSVYFFWSDVSRARAVGPKPKFLKPYPESACVRPSSSFLRPCVCPVVFASSVSLASFISFCTSFSHPGIEGGGVLQGQWRGAVAREAGRLKPCRLHQRPLMWFSCDWVVAPEDRPCAEISYDAT